MSTKIFNGYRLPKFNLDRLQAFNLSVRDKINDAALQISRNGANRIFVTTLDELTIGIYDNAKLLCDEKHSKDFTLLFHVNWYLNKSKKEFEEAGHSHPYFPTFNIVYIPIKSKLLSLVYTNNNELLPIWESLPEVSEYGYWNNTDKPKRISEKSWDRRRRDWDLAFEYSDIPSHVGLSHDFVNGLPFNILSKLQDINLDIIPFSERVDNLLPTMFIHGYVKTITTSLSETDKALNLEKFKNEAKAKYLDRKNDPFILKMLGEMRTFIESKLIKEVTPELLNIKCDYQTL